MGNERLESTKQTLRSAGFRVETGYSGDVPMTLSETVAAVNLTGFDGVTGKEKITVTILTPRTAGLEECQNRAMQAASALASGYSFDRWKYDELLDCFAIEVTAQLPAAQDPQLEVLLGDQQVQYVTGFTARQAAGRRLIGAMGSGEPSGVTPGSGGWILELKQTLPDTAPEPEQVEEPFALTVRRGGFSQVFTGCCWSEYGAEYVLGGVQVIRKGLALSREVG